MTIRDEEFTTICASQWDTIGEAEAEARKNQTLSGTYVVGLHSGSLDRRERSQLKAGILEHVKDTSALTVHDARDIVIAGRRVGDIRKYDKDGSAIYPVGGGTDCGGWESDIRTELGAILRSKIEKKVAQLSKGLQVVAFAGPRALVLYDLYRLADRGTVSNCVRAVPESAYFAYIYVVDAVDSGYSVRQPACTIRA